MWKAEGRGQGVKINDAEGGEIEAQRHELEDSVPHNSQKKNH